MRSLFPAGLALLLVSCPRPEPEPERTCDDVESEYFDALEQVSSCAQADECGQPILGTSCGCTRNLVARTDADLGEVADLQAEAGELECDIGGTSVCDCPEALGFDCLEGTCAFNLVERWPYLPACPQTPDAFQLDGVALVGDRLEIQVSYGGGCETHTFGLCWNDQAFQETNPPTARLTLFHDDGGDACDAWLYDSLSLSVAPLKEAFADQYGSQTGALTLSFEGQSFDYAF